MGNRIGTSADGLSEIGNTTGGVEVNGTSNRVGGTGPGAGNLISGNRSSGVLVSGDDSVVQGNLIGTDATGTAAVANTGAGVRIVSGGNLIGGTEPGAANVISGNGGDGVQIEAVYDDGAGNRIEGNRIGMRAFGRFPLGNAGNGVNVIDGPETWVGPANIITANGQDGVHIDRTSGDCVVDSNWIGFTASQPGTLVGELGNTGSGVTVDGPRATIAGNLIGDNDGTGVDVGFASTGSAVHNNFIGTDGTPGAIDGNGGDGVAVAADGTAVTANVIKNNAGAGVSLDADRVAVTLNAISNNTAAGVLASTTDNTIRLNRIDDNLGPGIDVGAAAPAAPAILAAETNGNLTRINFAYAGGQPNTDYSVDFYASPVCDPSGFGEGRIYLGSMIVHTNNGGNAAGAVVTDVPNLLGQVAAGTATIVTNAAPPETYGATSEFSGCAVVV